MTCASRGSPKAPIVRMPNFWIEATTQVQSPGTQVSAMDRGSPEKQGAFMEPLWGQIHFSLNSYTLIMKMTSLCRRGN